MSRVVGSLHGTGHALPHRYTRCNPFLQPSQGEQNRWTPTGRFTLIITPMAKDNEA